MEPSLEPPNTSGKAQACMLVLCGIPGSGKSTVAAALAAAAEASGALVTLVDFDKPAGDLLEEFDPEKWKKDRAVSLESVSQALKQSLTISAATATATPTTTATTCTHSSNTTEKHLVIVDDTMHYRSMRAECWRIARTTGAAYLFSHIKCPRDVALERNKLRPPGQRVPEEVFKRTVAIFEPPEESSHCPFDSNNYRVALETQVNVLMGEKHSDDTSRIKIEEGQALWQRVLAAWGPPAPAPFDEEAEEARVTEARKHTAESLIHHVDVQTRKYLTEVLSSSSLQHQQQESSGSGGGGGGEKKKIAADLNKERRQILERFRAEVLENERDISHERASEIIDGFRKCCGGYISS
jgi:O-phosphoseryl-tRNA(Sec) kinase